MKRYINTKTGCEVETVDELDSEDFESMRAFYVECRRLRAEYEMALKCRVWVSTRQLHLDKKSLTC